MNISKINSNMFFKQRYNVSNHFTPIKTGNANYNSSSGDYDVTVKGFLPIIKRRELYYPNKETEVIIRRTPDGIKKITKTPTQTITQIFDKSAILKQDKDFSIIDDGALDYKNGEIYRLRETSLGSRYLLRYDKFLNRKIKISETKEGRSAKIYDAKTGKPVIKGALIYDTNYDKETGEETIENLLTGFVVERTQYQYKSKEVQKRVKYYENSTNPKYIYNLDNSTGKSTAQYIDKEGNTLRLEINHPSDKSKEIYTYDSEGNVLTHKELIYGFSLTKKKPVASEIIYNPDNSDINQIIDSKGNKKTITEYSSTEKEGENYPLTALHFKDNQLYKFEKFQNYGENTLSTFEFSKSGKVKYTLFNKEGQLEQINYFDNIGNLLTSLDFVPVSGKLASVTKYNQSKNTYKQYIYSNYSKYPINIIKYDENNNIQKLTVNLDDKNIPKNLSSLYFVNGNYDFTWENEKEENTDTLKLPKNKEEAFLLSKNLEQKSFQALKLRQLNFIRLG